MPQSMQCRSIVAIKRCSLEVSVDIEAGCAKPAAGDSERVGIWIEVGCFARSGVGAVEHVGLTRAGAHEKQSGSQEIQTFCMHGTFSGGSGSAANVSDINDIVNILSNKA